MARNKVKMSGYSFVNGTRQITVSEAAYDGFDIGNIRLIYNETQKVLICSTGTKDLITSIVGNVITYSNSLPALVTGDRLTIEMDMGMVGVDGVVADYNDYRTKVANAATLKGQNATMSDTGDQIYNKIIAITSNVTVTPIQELNPYWHDLAVEIANWEDAENPYAFAILLEPGITQIFLSGADKYKVSDGRIFNTNQTITFGANEAGRESKLTKYVIFRTATPYFSQSFGSYPNTPLNRRILACYNKGNDWSAISFDTCRTPYFINDVSVKNPIIFGGDRKLLALSSRQFYSNTMSRFVFPPFADDATLLEKETLIIPPDCFNGCSLSDIQFPVGLKTLTISGGNAFYNCSSLTSLIFPVGLQTLTISGISAFNNCSSLTYAFLPKSLSSVNISTLSTASVLSNLEFENGWNRTINVPNTTLTAVNVKNNMLDRLEDKRGDGINPTTASMSTSSPIVTFTNGNCLNIFRAGDTITLTGGTVRTILTVDNANQVTLTANGSHDLSNVSYNINRTLTLTTTVKDALVTAYGANWADAYTAKGWTIA